jgi:hypothetical protein
MQLKKQPVRRAKKFKCMRSKVAAILVNRIFIRGDVYILRLGEWSMIHCIYLVGPSHRNLWLAVAVRHDWFGIVRSSG